MKKLAYLFCLIVMLSCDGSAEAPEIAICPADASAVQVLTVDYTTNEFLGGYTIQYNWTPSFEMACDYKAPGDFGSVRWYDKASGQDLFAGTIIWMGKGERTFPEKFYEPTSFPKTNKYAAMPAISLLKYDEFVFEHDVDFSPIWKGVEHIDAVRWVNESTPAYAYLYTPSVGVGDPRDWYWVIFLKY